MNLTPAEQNTIAHVRNALRMGARHLLEVSANVHRATGEPQELEPIMAALIRLTYWGHVETFTSDDVLYYRLTALGYRIATIANK